MPVAAPTREVGRLPALFTALGGLLVAFGVLLLVEVLRPDAAETGPVYYVHAAVLVAFEVTAVVLIVRRDRDPATAGESSLARRNWRVVAGSATCVAAAHLTYLLLIPSSAAGSLPRWLSPTVLGAFVHVLQSAFFVGSVYSLVVLIRRQLPRPGPAVLLDGLVVAFGVGALGAAALMPELQPVGVGWVPAAAGLLSVLGSLVQLGMLAAYLVVAGGTPDRTWWGSVVVFLLVWVGVASTLVPIALGVAAPVLVWWCWPAGLLVLAWRARNYTDGTTTDDARRSALSITMPTVLSIGALGILAVDQVVPQPGLVVGLALAGVLAVTLRTVVAVRLAVRLAERDRLLSERLQQSNDEALAAGRAKSYFIATMSHEIRTPLNAILVTAELLAATRLTRVQRDCTDNIRHGGTVLLDLVTRGLDSASLETDQLRLESRPFELAEAVTGVLDLLSVTARAKGLRLRAEIDPATPAWVVGDLTRLRQVLLNLVGNAVKFTDQGTVTVEVCPAARSDDAAAVYFQVSDTGIGISSAGISRLFRPFSQVSAPADRLRGGSGLGLAISQAIVERMGGTINVTSQEGVGTAFGFEAVLPRAGVPAAVATVLRGRRIAVVDWQRSRAHGLAQRLRTWGAATTVELRLQRWWESEADVVLVREDHPDVVAGLVAQLSERARTRRPPMMIISTAAHVVDQSALPACDTVRDVAAADARLRQALVQMIHCAGQDQIDLPELNDPRSEEAETTPLRVLLAEDDPVSARVVEMLLRRLGHLPTVVTTGRAAVDCARAEHFDVILMDSHLPELDGIEATVQIRALQIGRAAPPIFAMTGSLTPADRQAYLAAGMDGVLAKPLTSISLSDALDHLPRFGTGDRAPQEVSP